MGHNASSLHEVKLGPKAMTSMNGWHPIIISVSLKAKTNALLEYVWHFQLKRNKEYWCCREKNVILTQSSSN